MTRCSYPGCTAALRAKGLCCAHLYQLKHGGALRPVTRWKSTEERVMAKVERRGPGECWPWTASLNANRYGLVRYRGCCRLATRVVFEIVVGPIPAGLNVLHRCDNPPCVNPAHLFLGTQLDNVADMIAKGRADWSGLLPGSRPGRVWRHRRDGLASEQKTRKAEVVR